VADVYTQYFVKLIGGDFVWSEFRPERLSRFFLVTISPAILVKVYDLYSGAHLERFLVFAAFGSIALIGLLSFISSRFRAYILIENADLDKAKLGLGLMVFTGLFGISIPLIPFVAVD